MGLTFLQSGEYNPRGYPGYPLYEFFIYSISDKGPFFTNSISAISGYLCILIFKLILESHCNCSKNISFFISLMLCFTPTIWIASTTTMDYLFAEFLLLFSWYLTKNRKYTYFSAIFFGLSITARPNYLIFLLPIIVGVLLVNKDNLRSFKPFFKFLTSYLSICFITSFLIFLPQIINHGFIDKPGVLFNYSNLSILQMGFNSIRLFGVIGTFTITVFSILIIYKVNLNHNIIKIFLEDPSCIISLLGITVNILLFISFPDELFYLIPSIPFFLYLLAKITNFIKVESITSVLISVILILFINNFIDLKFWKKNDFKRKVISKPYFGVGILFNDFRERKLLSKQNKYIFDNNFKRPCIIVTGWHGPIIGIYKNRFEPNSSCDCEIVQFLDEDKMKEMVNNGLDIYFTDAAETQINLLFNYSLKKYVSKHNAISDLIKQ